MSILYHILRVFAMVFDTAKKIFIKIFDTAGTVIKTTQHNAVPFR